MAEVLRQATGQSCCRPCRRHAARSRWLKLRARRSLRWSARVLSDVVFTSGATEANNLAIMGTAASAHWRVAKEPHIVTLATEHKSVLEPVRALAIAGRSDHDTEARQRRPARPCGARTRPAAANPPGHAAACEQRDRRGAGHRGAVAVCAARTLCRCTSMPRRAPASCPWTSPASTCCPFTAHKLGGPQGIGALYVAPTHRGQLQSQMLGGGHERGLRAGTLATHQIAGFGLACELAAAARAIRGAARSRRCANGSGGTVRNCRRCCSTAIRYNARPASSMFTFPAWKGRACSRPCPELTLSTGSACNSRSGEPSYVLRALGRDSAAGAEFAALQSRVETPRAADVDAAIAVVQRVHYLRLREAVAGHCTADRRLAGAGRTLPAEKPAPSDWAPGCGSPLKVLNGVVQEARVQVYGCPHTIAACRQLAEGLRGRPLAALAPGTPEQWRVSVAAPVEKLGRMLIIEDALRALRPA